MKVLNQYSISVMGIMLDLIGSFILTLEAFGLLWTSNFLQKLIKFSKWVKVSLRRLTIVVLLLSSPFLIQFFFESKILNSLYLPIVFLISLAIILIDHPEQINNWTFSKFNNRQLTPFGFLLILLGSIFQLIGTIMQI